jgi:hypothetical protein
MISDEALKVTDEALFSHTDKHLTDIQQELGIPLAEECKKLKGELEERGAPEGK